MPCHGNEAIRNSGHAIAEHQAVAPLMFIGNHLIYQTLVINDMQVRVEAPPEVQEYIMKNESFSGSGNTYHGEGGITYLRQKTNILKGIKVPVYHLLHTVTKCCNKTAVLFSKSRA